MSWATRLFLIVLCSKVYFLLGYFPGTHLTAAPVWVVAIRDIALGSLIGYFLTRPGLFRNLFQRKGPLLWIWALFITGLVVGSIHLLGEKPIRDVFQHYFRNGLIPTILAPLGLWALILRLDFPDLRKSLKIFMFINVFASYPQLIWTELMWVNRPTGILGDPLLNSVFILIGLWLLFQDRQEQKNWLTYGGLILAIPIVYLSNSLSSITAFIVSSVFVLALEFRRQNEKMLWLRARLQRLIVAGALCVAISIALALSLQQETNDLEHGVVAKSRMLYDSLFCTENCGPKKWFVEGRVRSNLFAVELCQAEPDQCVVGHWQSADFHRLDSLWASLVVNWGLVFTVLYLILFLALPLRNIWKLQTIHRDTRLAWFVFSFYWVFSLLNAGYYKYPMNLLFYLSVAVIFYQARLEKTKA